MERKATIGIMLTLLSISILTLALNILGDTPYIINENNTDRNPLMNPEPYDWSMHGYDAACTSHSPSTAPNTNATNWVSPLPGGTVWASPIVAEGNVFLGTGGNLTAWDENDGSLIWSFYAPAQPGYPREVAAANGRVFLGTAEPGPEGCVYALNATTGEELWNFTAEGCIRLPIIIEDRLYFGADLTSTGKIYCINAMNGAHIWNQPTQDLGVRVAAAYGKLYTVCGHWQTSAHAEISCWDMYDGGLEWSFSTDRTLTGGLSVAHGKVYATVGNINSGCIVYALNATNGDEIWSTTRYSSGNAGRTAVANGKVFVALGGADRGVYALNATNGDEIWDFPLSTNARGVIIADGKVFFTESSPSHNFRAVNETTGTVIWKYELGGSVASASCAVANGQVFVADHYDPKLYAFGPARLDYAVLEGDISFNPPSPVHVNTSVAIDADVHNVGLCWVNLSDTGDYVGYDFSLPDTKSYSFTVRIKYCAIFESAGAVRIEILILGVSMDLSIEFDIVGTTGWQVVEKTGVAGATAGDHTLRVWLVGGVFTDILIDWIELTYDTTTVPTFEAEAYNSNHSAGVNEIYPSDVTVQFFDGDPDTGGTQIDGNQTAGDQNYVHDLGKNVTYIKNHGAATASVVWTANSIGHYDIYVVVDPDGTFPEENETNNIAFKTIGVYIALTITVSGGGTTSPSPNTYLYYSETTVVVTAIPNGGFFFYIWKLKGETLYGSPNPISVVMNKDRTLHAVFYIEFTAAGGDRPSNNRFK